MLQNISIILYQNKKIYKWILHIYYIYYLIYILFTAFLLFCLVNKLCLVALKMDLWYHTMEFILRNGVL